MEELRKFVLEMMDKHPALKEQIISLWHLCQDEVEAGESESNEIELCYSGIRDLIAENE